MYTLTDFRMLTINLSGYYRPHQRTTLRLRSSLGMNRIGDWQRGYVVRGDVEHRLPHGHEIEIGVLGQRYLGAELDRVLFMVSYAIPIDLPISPSRVGGRLIGSVVDTRTNEGVGNVRVFLGDRTALTDKRGRFAFAGLESGSYRLGVSHGDLGLDIVPIEPLPKMVDVKAPVSLTIRIDVTAASEVYGTVNLFESNAKGRLSTDQAPTLKGALRNVVVELVRDSVRYQQVTDRSGAFTFAGLAPGVWALHVRPNSVPPDHEARLQTTTFELKGGERKEVKIDIVPRARRIRFIQPDEHSEFMPPHPAVEGTAPDHPADKDPDEDG